MKRLISIQSELKCNKSQYNKFGKYAYRSCEDILEAVKPLLLKYGCCLILTDDIVQISDRFYVKATASLIGDDGIVFAKTNAFAREDDLIKGMTGSQITGSASSYARKYALNGLFCIDDTKDSDATNTHGKEDTNDNETQKKDVLSPNQLKIISGYPDVTKDWILQKFKIGCIDDLTKKQATNIIIEVNKKKEKDNVPD